MPILNFRAETKTEEGVIRPAPELLANGGPVIPVTIALLDQAQRAYTERGEQMPDGVTGFALIDTGASTTCFDEAAARRARLPVIGVARMASASHANHEVPLFAGKIICPTINIDVENSMGASLAGAGMDLIALIGRDVLKSCVFIYNGPDGSFSITN